MDASPRWQEMLRAAVLALAVALNLVVLWREPVWGMRNELAHFDRMYQLGREGVGDQFIHDDVFAMTLDEGLRWKQPPGFDGTKAGMGTEGLSYERHQPAPYYAALAVLDAVIAPATARGEARVKSLRTAHYLLLFIPGVILLVAIFRELHLLVAVDARWGWVVAVGATMTATSWAATLGNDVLSLSSCQLAVWSALRAVRRKSGRWLLASGIATGLAVAAKLTNVLALPVLGLFLAWLWRRAALPRGNVLASGGSCLFIVAALLLANVLLHGSPFGDRETAKVFSATINPVNGAWRLLRVLLASSVQNRHFGLQAPEWLPRVMMAVLLLNALISGMRWREGRTTAWEMLVLAACAATAGVMAAAVMLNAQVPGVRWAGFRHFCGLSLVWWVAFASLPVPPRPAVARWLPDAVLAVLAAVLARAAWLMVAP